MPEANIKFVNIEPNKFNEEQTRLSIAFEIDGETKYMNYTIAGGSEAQQKFASFQLAKLLKTGGPYKVNVERDEERGRDNVYADDGFRSGQQANDDGGF